MAGVYYRSADCVCYYYIIIESFYFSMDVVNHFLNGSPATAPFRFDG